MENYRISEDSAVYFFTFTIVEWLPVFVSEAACKIVTDSLTFCHQNKGLRTNACVIMPTHLHAIVFHEGFRAEPLKAALADFRKFTAIERLLCETCSGLLCRDAP